MDSVVLGWKKPLARLLPELLYFYVKPPATIVDLSAGYRLFYKRTGNSGLDHPGYKFIFGDIRNLPDIDLVCDIRNSPVRDNIADAVIFDPPYGYSHKNNRRLAEIYTRISPEAALDLIANAAPEIYRILKPFGTLIFKIGNRHKHKEYFPLDKLSYVIFEEFGFKQYDEIIFGSALKHPISNRPFADKVHSYFMIFKKNRRSYRRD